MYEVDIESGMVSLDGKPVGLASDLLATLTKEEVSRDELDTCYAVAVALHAATLAYVAAAETRIADRTRWTQADVEREAEARLQRKLFEVAVKERTAEKFADAALAAE